MTELNHGGIRRLLYNIVGGGLVETTTSLRAEDRDVYFVQALRSAYPFIFPKTVVKE